MNNDMGQGDRDSQAVQNSSGKNEGSAGVHHQRSASSYHLPLIVMGILAAAGGGYLAGKGASQPGRVLRPSQSASQVVAPNQNMAASSDAELDTRMAKLGAALDKAADEAVPADVADQPSVPAYVSAEDRQIQLGQKQAIETNEMLCRQYGQNCEAAKLFRRQYEERYGR